MSTVTTVEAHPSYVCDTCQDYIEARLEVLPDEILLTARRHNISPDALLLEFMHSVHRRHTEGHSLAPKPCHCANCEAGVA